jgi:hypothetical protein
LGQPFFSVRRIANVDMRAKVILSATLLAVAAVWAAVYYHSALNSTPAPEAQGDTTAADSGVQAQPTASSNHLRPIQPALAPKELPAPDVSGRELTASNHADYVLERKAQLMDLTSSDDPGALKTILSALNDPDVDIRKTALTAAVEAGNADAIPALQNQLGWTQDPAEKVEIQNAIDFLQLPSADQVNAEITAAKAAEQPPAPDGNTE